jgi:hypothetical protein
MKAGKRWFSAAVVSLCVLAAVSVYFLAYVAMSDVISDTSGERDRQFSSHSQVTLFAPAAKIESAVIGRRVDLYVTGITGLAP